MGNICIYPDVVLWGGTWVFWGRRGPALYCIFRFFQYIFESVCLCIHMYLYMYDICVHILRVQLNGQIAYIRSYIINWKQMTKHISGKFRWPEILLAPWVFYCCPWGCPPVEPHLS